LQKVKKIESLSLSGCAQLGNGAIAVINGMQHIYKLSLSETKELFKVLPMPTVKYLTMKKLRTFSLGKVGVLISRMPQLISLDLTDTKDLLDSDLTLFSTTLTSLKALNISSCDRVGNTGVKTLSALKTLEVLDLG